MTNDNLLTAETLFAALQADEKKKDSYTALFERDNRDVLVVVTLRAGDGPADSYLAGQLEATRITQGFSVVAIEERRVVGRRSKSLRRVRVATNGAIAYDESLDAGQAHAEIVRWWKGESVFAGVL